MRFCDSFGRIPTPLLRLFAPPAVRRQRIQCMDATMHIVRPPQCARPPFMRVRICGFWLIEIQVQIHVQKQSCVLSTYPSHHDLFSLAGIIADSIGGIVALRSRPMPASQSGLFCSSASNAITSFADVNSNPSLAPSAFSFANASSSEYLVSSGTARVLSPTNRDVTPVSQSLTAIDLVTGFNLALSAGLTFAVQCEATLPSYATIVGCALNNR
jgi:hypothetical protein